MKTLVFGFEPYDKYKENITEAVVKRLRERKNLRKVIFPVVFNKKVFIKAIEEYKPDTILGLGQNPRGRKIQIERKARNPKGSPHYRFLNSRLRANKDACVSYNAGDYVCNFCMYVISEAAEKRSIKFAFLHIPKDYNVLKATKFVENTIDEILK